MTVWRMAGEVSPIHHESWGAGTNLPLLMLHVRAAGNAQPINIM
jgi:hypothetical protein